MFYKYKQAQKNITVFDLLLKVQISLKQRMFGSTSECVQQANSILLKRTKSDIIYWINVLAH